MATRVEVPEQARTLLARWYDGDLLASVVVARGSLFGIVFGLFGQYAVTINQRVHLTRHAPDPESDSGTVILGHEL